MSTVPATITRAHLAPGLLPRTVHSTDTLAAALDPVLHYGAAAAADLVVVPPAQVDQVGQGWTWDGATFAPPPGPSAADLLGYASARQNARLAEVWTFAVAAPGQPAHTVTTRLDDRGAVGMMKLALWLQLNAGNAGATLPYSNVDDTPDTLTFAEVDALVAKAGALDTESYAIYNRLCAGIRAVPPTVATFAQIDEAWAALAA